MHFSVEFPGTIPEETEGVKNDAVGNSVSW